MAHPSRLLTPYPLYRRLVRPRAHPDGCGKSRLFRDSIPGPSIPYRFIKGWEFINRMKINLLTPNINYIRRTAPLTSEVAFYIFIQQV